MYDDLYNDDSLQDNSNFGNEYNEDYDFIEDYENMMKELDEQEPLSILPDFDENDDFYQAIDNWDNGEYMEEISERLTKKGKRSYDKYKEDENEFKKEFADDIDSVDISVEKLKKLKISSSVLEAETLLRKVFGDDGFNAFSIK